MMMTFDLSERQASRVLEQALRGGVDLEIEPRNWNGDAVLSGVLRSREGRLLTVRIGPRNSTRPLTELMGRFCDVRCRLSGELYIFSTCVLDVSDLDPGTVLLAQPDAIQIVNRRGFERTAVHVASQIRLCPRGQSVASVGLLNNISATGLACTIPGLELDESLCIGDEVLAVFELAGAVGSFELNCVVCDKRVRRESQQVELGLEYRVAPADQTGTLVLTRLRRLLAQVSSHQTKANGEA